MLMLNAKSFLASTKKGHCVRENMTLKDLIQL